MEYSYYDTLKTYLICSFILILVHKLFENMKKKKYIISIEGNIGAGKTTFLEKLKENINNAVFIKEPVDIWLSLKDDEGENILEKFYKNPKRWCYTFQNLAFITRLKSLLEEYNNTDKKYIITDRVTESDKKIFATMSKEDGLMTNIEWNIYNFWYNNEYINKLLDTKVYTIYLKSSPNVCLERIKKRNRGEEINININYLEKLHILHEKWLNKNKKADILVLNNDINYLENKTELDKHIQKVKEFFNLLDN